MRSLTESGPRGFGPRGTAGQAEPAMSGLRGHGGHQPGQLSEPKPANPANCLGMNRSIGYILRLGMLRYCLRNSIPFPARRLALYIAALGLSTMMVVPSAALLLGYGASLVGTIIGLDSAEVTGLLLVASIVLTVVSAMTAITGRSRAELNKPVDGPHFSGLDLHPWAPAVALVFLPRAGTATVRALAGSLAVIGVELATNTGTPQAQPAVAAVTLALVPWGGAVLATGIQIFLSRSLKADLRPGVAGTAVSAITVFVGAFWATRAAARRGLLEMPGDQLIIGWLGAAGHLGSDMTIWALGGAVASGMLGITIVLAQGRSLGNGAHRHYLVPGSQRKPAAARQVDPAAQAGSAVTGKPGTPKRGLQYAMLVLQIRHGTSQAPVLYRNMERLLPLLGCAMSGFGAAVLLTGAQAQIGWLQIASAGTLATATLLVALTLTSASGPVSWIPRIRWLVDSGYSLPALCRTYLWQLLRLCTLPLALPVLGFCLIQGSAGPAMEAATLIPILVGTALLADLADRQRQVNTDGSVEGGLTGTLVLVAAMAGCTTVWLLPWPVAMAVTAAAAAAMLFAAHMLFHRRVQPWRIDGHESTPQMAPARLSPTTVPPREGTQ